MQHHSNQLSVSYCTLKCMTEALNMQKGPLGQYVTGYTLFFNLEKEQFHVVEPTVVYG